MYSSVHAMLISTSTFETAHLIPCCMRRVEDILLMKMLNQQYFDNEIDELLLLSAISTPSLCGELDYQRLELLGEPSCMLLRRGAF